jgi:hypothetical protein
MNVAIEYRQLPECLTTASIVAELIWIADAVTWRGPVGDHARQRAETLRAELQRREWQS